MEILIAALAARQPSGVEMYLKVHQTGDSLEVDLAYVREGRTISKHYHVFNTPLGVDIQLANFSIR